MKELGPNEGMNALRHPDCRFCDEYQLLIRGRDAEIQALKKKLANQETDPGVDAGCLRSRAGESQTASVDSSVGEPGDWEKLAREGGIADG